jgi:aminoglycoside N3'-acetyltransferase
LNHPEQGEMEILITSMMGSTIAFNRMEDTLRERQRIREGRIGDAKCQLMRGQDVIDATVDILYPIFASRHGQDND